MAAEDRKQQHFRTLNDIRQRRMIHAQEGRKLDLEEQRLVRSAKKAGLTFQEIGDALQVTRGRASQIEKGGR